MAKLAVTKSMRLLQLEALLLGHPAGLSQAEIARRLGVNRSTINRYIPDLPGHFYIDDLDGGRWKIDRQGYLVNVCLNLDEAMAIHLATRLLTTRMDRQNPHAAAALRKLGLALEKLAPRISKHMQQSADVIDAPYQRKDPNFLRTLETLTLAWAQQRKVKIWHRHEGGTIKEYVFAPYFLEPYAVGQAIHVIGWREPPDALRTLKVERIDRVELLRGEAYAIPADFDPTELLADAWGIWYTEEEPVRVVLKFSRQAAGRVKETRWHRSEKVSELADGSLLWEARIASTVEMLPWIRGWGAEVEVIEPEELRQQLVKETEKQYQIYHKE